MFHAADKTVNCKKETISGKKTDFAGFSVAPKGKAETESRCSFEDVRVHYNTDRLVQFQAFDYNQRNPEYSKHDQGNIVQCMNLINPAAPNKKSQLIAGVKIDNATSVVAFIKMGGEKTFGHSAVVLEHEDGGVLTNFVIDLGYNGNDETCWIYIGAIPDNILEIEGGKKWNTINQVHSNNVFEISHNTGNTLLQEAAKIIKMVNDKNNPMKYKLIKYMSDTNSMNCATFSKLLAKNTAVAIGVDDPDYDDLRSIRAGHRGLAGLKTPSTVAGV